MDPRRLPAARAEFGNVLDELDTKVKYVQAFGYPMPEGNSQRSEFEIDLLALAETALWGTDPETRDRARSDLFAAANKDK